MKGKSTIKATRRIAALIAIATALVTGGAWAAGADKVMLEDAHDIVIYGSSSAASMAAANGAAVQDVPYAALRKRLDADGQIVNLQK